MGFITHHKWIIVVGALALAGLVWMVLSSSSSTETPTLTNTATGAVATQTASGDQDLVALLLTLRAVKLDGNIFTDPAFSALHDFSTDIVPEPVGRQNPFAPLATSTAATSTNATNAILNGTQSPRTR